MSSYLRDKVLYNIISTYEMSEQLQKMQVKMEVESARGEQPRELVMKYFFKEEAKTEQQIYAAFIEIPCD